MSSQMQLHYWKEVEVGSGGGSRERRSSVQYKGDVIRYICAAV